MAERTFRTFNQNLQAIMTSNDQALRNNNRWQLETSETITRAGAEALGAVRDVLRLATYELQVHQHFLFEFNSNPAEGDRFDLWDEYRVPVSERLLDLFRDIVLVPTLAMCDALCLSMRSAELAPSPGVQNQSDYKSWLGELRDELERLVALVNTLQSLLDTIVQGIMIFGHVQESPGLHLDIVKAIPKFQRRVRDKRRNHLVSVIVSVHGGAGGVLDWCALDVPLHAPHVYIYASVNPNNRHSKRQIASTLTELHTRT